jgi:hypothetical protein
MRIPHRSHTTHTRDAALRDLQRINRWMIAGSVILTGVLSDVAANAFPGKTVKHTSATSGKATKKKSGAGAKTKTTTGVLRAPEQPPAKAESEPAQESAPSEPAQESAPAQESEPTQEAAPERESAPVQEAAPEREAAPTQEAAPEAEAPVVSGGS